MTGRRLPLYPVVAAIVLAAVAWMISCGPAAAQQTAKVVTTCGAAGYTAGSTNYVTIDTTGDACSSASGGGGGGTSSNFGAAFPTPGTAAGFKSSSGSLMAPGNLDSSGNILVNVAAGGAGGGAVYGPTAVGSAAANPPVIVGGTVGHTATGNVQVIDVNTSGQAAIQAPPTLPLPTGAATAANQTTAIGSLSTIATNTTNAATTTNQSSQITQETAINTVLGTVTASPTANTLADRLKTINTTLGSPFQAAGSIGNTAFGISGTLPAFAATPTFNCGTGCFQATQPVSGTVTANAGTNLNTSLLATSANLTAGTEKTQIVDGSGNVIASTSNNLDVQCANCSGSGVSTADQASFTAGTSLFAGSGGFFQTTATSNPLTTGQQGEFQVTSTRALFSNLRNAAGTEVGTSSTPLQVSLANTGSNATALLVTGTGGSFPVSGTIAATQSGTWNITNVSGTVSLPTGASTEVTLAKLAVAQGSTTSGQSGPLTLGAVTTGAPAYTTAQSSPLSLTTAGALRTDASATTQPVSGTVTANAGTGNFTVVNGGTFAVQNSAATPAGSAIIGKVGIDQTTPGTTNGVQVNAALPAGTNVIGHVIADSGSTTAVTGTVTVSGTVTANAGTGTFNIQSNASTNTAQVNGVTTLTGTGATGTGSQRVTVAQDTNTVAGSASIPAGTNLMGKVGFDQTTPGTTNGVQDAATGSTGSAAPSKASYVGANSSGNLTGLVQADTTAAINVSTATTTQLVALSSGKKIYVTHWDVIAAAADNVTLEYGTGSACATGTTVLTGAYNLAANGGISAGGGLGPVLVVPASNALCIVTSAAAQASGVVSYTQF